LAKNKVRLFFLGKIMINKTSKKK